jgi:hypothetical protein
MICDDSAEYVSALCDGEVIPRSAAEHIGTCPDCQVRLRDYLGIGVELRRTASLEVSSSVRPLAWAKPQNRLFIWWQKGLATMRIPRLAFVVLIAGVVALASSLAVVKVRAHADGTVVLLSISAGTENPIECALSTVDKKFQQCGFIGNSGGNVLGYKIQLLSRSDTRVQLGVRARQWPASAGTSVSYGLEDVDGQPEQQFWFEPGDTLKIDNPGLPTLAVKGTWLDHMPSFVGTNEMDPGPDELRIISPLLLQGKEVAGDLAGGAATQTKPDWAVFIYFPKRGGYLIANSHIQGAIEARVDLNRISFEEDGHSNVLLTGAPITRAQHVWVLHRPNFNPSTFGQNGEYAFISGEALRQAGPGIWAPTTPMN